MYILEQQGSVIQIKEKTACGDGREPVVSKRGAVTRFSSKSRKRLCELFNRMTFVNRKTIFITLTFHSIPTHEDARQAFKRFLERLRYKNKNVCLVWRKELQARGAIHYHMLAWNLPFYPQKDLQDVWTECTGENRSIADIRMVKSKKHAMMYVSKYLGKVNEVDETSSLDTVPYPQNEQKPSTGRWWGYFRKPLLPMAQCRKISVKNIAGLFYLKFTMKSLSFGRCASRTLSGMLFHDDAEKMFRSFVEREHLFEVHTPNLVRWINGGSAFGETA